MTEEFKNMKLDDEMMEGVAGGSSAEMVSDEQCVSAMLKLKNVNPGIVAEAFAKGNVKVTMNSGDKGNIYTYNGRRISRYEALVRLGRGNNCGNFDIRNYLSASHKDNKARNVND